MRQPNAVDDSIGIAISWLCIIQCLAEPFLKAYMPALSWSVSEHTHVILAFWIAFFASAALAPGALRHCNSRIRLLMIPGVLSVVVATAGALMGIPEVTEILLCLAGNCLVILAHSQNKKLIHVRNSLCCIADDRTVDDRKTSAQSC